MHLYKIVFIVLCVSVMNLHAQSEYGFKRFSTLDGLSNNAVYDICCDDFGRVWFATNDGISSFDGYRFQKYKPDINNPELAGYNNVSIIAPGLDGNIWFATLGMSVSVLNSFDASYKHYNLFGFEKNEFMSKRIHSLLPMNNKVYVGSSFGISIINTGNNSVTDIKADSIGLSGTIHSILRLQNDLLLVSTSSGFSIINPANKQLEVKNTFIQSDLGITKNINRVVLSGLNEVLVVTHDGVKEYVFVNEQIHATGFEIKRSDLQLTIKEPLSAFQNVRKSNNDQVWISTQRGLLVVENGKASFLRKETENPESLSGNQVLSMMHDHEGNLWVGTKYHGVNMYNPFMRFFSKFNNRISTKSHMHDNDVRALLEDKRNNIWVGYKSLGLDVFNPVTKQFTYYNGFKNNGLDKPFNGIRDIYQDRQRSIWIGSNNGLVKAELRSGAYQFQPVKVNDRVIRTVYYIFEDSKGQLFFAGNQGLFIYREGVCEKVRIKNESVPVVLESLFIRCIIEDKEGNLWLATDRNGIVKVNLQNEELQVYNSQLNNPMSLSHNKVYSLYFDARDQLWAATHNGLNKMMNSKGDFKKYTTDEGLINDVVYSIQDDKEGNLWLSTAYGLSKMYAGSETFQTHLRGFEFSDDAWFKTKEGDILVGGINGFYKFTPDHLETNAVKPIVNIVGFNLQEKVIKKDESYNKRIVLEQPISQTKNLVLNHNENFFSFDLLAVSLSKPKQVKYLYKLDGFNEDWIEVAPDWRKASFTNVPPGEYTFRVKAANSDNAWSDEKQISVVIEPAYYQTLMFQVLLLVVIIALIISIYWLRLRNLMRKKSVLQEEVAQKTKDLRQRNEAIEQKNKELKEEKDKVVHMTRRIHEADERKLKFFTNISHEIRTPLTLISSPLDKLLESISPKDHNYQTLDLIQRNAQRLKTLVNQIMDFRKLDSGQLPINLKQGCMLQTVKSICDNFNGLAKEKNIQLNLKFLDEPVLIAFDEDVIEKILSNLLSNAIKYTQTSGSIDVKLENTEKLICITVQDNGPGIPAEQHDVIFKRFYRADNQSHNATGGSGIGLALAHEMAMLHGGTLQLLDTSEKGACFKLCLPKKLDESCEADLTELHECQTEYTALAHKHDKTVLIIEDNTDLRLFIKDVLKGWSVLEAEDGEKGLELAKKEQPDIIVSDVLMPKMDGFEVCRSIKQDVKTNHIPVILLTALGAEESQIKGIDCGAEDYIVKPFNHRVLMGKIFNILTARENFKEALAASLQTNEVNKTNWKDRLPAFVKEIIEVIEENMADSSFGVKELSDLLGMSKSTLYRKMKSVTNKSTVEFIREVKMQKALELFNEDQTIRVSEVAFLVGFEDVNYFRECFKKQFGINPSEVLEQVKGLSASN
ncbi:MAG: response regulator [Carboxylicivirga sp.]|jgi:signal transduction histidine kinase/ligand-binding sensor domain-containing protein/AraC-like DNA-binding protein|nr:response regulator [Carboxylicivirga sp.]